MTNALSLRRSCVALVLGVLGFAGPHPAAQAQDYKVPIHFDGGFTLVPGAPVGGFIPIDITVFGESDPGGVFVGSGEGHLAEDLSHGWGSVTFRYECGTLTVFYVSRLIDPNPVALTYSCRWMSLSGDGVFDGVTGGGPRFGDLVIVHNPDVFSGVFTADGTILLAPPKK